MRPSAGPRFFALPARRAWFPLVLPLLVLLVVAIVLWREAVPQAELHFPLALRRILSTYDEAPSPAAPGLLDHAVSASGLLEPVAQRAWDEPGVWLALPGGPTMARWLEPELRWMLGLRGKLSSGGPFMLPGPLLLNQAGPAAEALLRHSPQATTVAQAKE
jgi:hypothetical protein